MRAGGPAWGMQRPWRARWVCAVAPCGAACAQVVGWGEGDPAAKMFRPWLPPRLNLTGIALPPFAMLTVGGLSTGAKKPVKVYRDGGGLFFASSTVRSS